jgi:hypothetical protein
MRFAIPFVVGFLLAAIACQTPAILVPAQAPTTCRLTEHRCAAGGCCLGGFACGGPQPDLFTTCPVDACCDERDSTRRMKARR